MRSGHRRTHIAPPANVRGTPYASDRETDNLPSSIGSWSDRPFIPIFIRLQSGSGTELWPGLILNFRQVARLISPWNQDHPAIRAYALRRLGADSGITLMETSDIINLLNKQFQIIGSSKPLIAKQPIVPPEILHIPRSGGTCPYTGLKHTVITELVAARSAYGYTGIKRVPRTMPGNISGRLMISTESLLGYIRSLPPPQYKMGTNPFPRERSSVRV